MKLTDRISKWVDAHESELLRDIGRLVAVRSVRGEAAPDAPFGPEPKAALDEALALCGEYGFATANFDNCIGTADLNDAPERSLDILGHLDVVAEGEGWDTDPYKTERSGDLLYGRGTDDDKGPVVMALYAMRCVRELGLPLKYNCRLIMGTDEESGSDDLPHYYSKHAPAPQTFTPDSGFPIYNVEKGGYKPVFTASWDKTDVLPRVASFDGGFRINVVPADASAVVLGLDAEAAEHLVPALAEECGVGCAIESVPGGIRLSAHGIQAHAATPWDGNNGLTALLHILAALPLGDCPSARAVGALSELFPHGDWLGRALGIAQRDAVSGDLTLSFTLLSMTETGLRGQFDSRAPVCACRENCSDIAEARLAAAGFGAEGEMAKPHHTPAEGKFVSTLLRCYETYTGEKGECLYTGGGTYVHDIPGGVAFGAGMPGFDSHLHGANERISIRDSLAACKIFALAIAQLCGGD